MSPAFKPAILIVSLFTIFIPLVSSFARYSDNPGADQPDESFMLGDALYPTTLENALPNTDVKSKVAVLDNGYSREAILFLGLYLPVRVVKEKEFSSQASSISLFIIPSGSLSELKDPDGFRASLSKFAEDGGTLFVFSQRYGKEYAILPFSGGDSIKGYGWLEDQSSLRQSSIMTMRHTSVSGLTSSRPNLNIDGFFTSFPRNGKPILRNNISGQPVMLIYRYGKGNIIASTLFTDWAYMHGRATWDEVALFSGILRWTGLTLASTAPKTTDDVHKGPVLPAPLPAIGFSVQSDNEMYMAGSIASFTVRLWNNEDKKRTIKVYLDATGHKVELLPHGSGQFTYSIQVYSSRRLWVYFYDEKEIFLQTLKKGYTVVYPTE